MGSECYLNPMGLVTICYYTQTLGKGPRTENLPLEGEGRGRLRKEAGHASPVINRV